MTRRHDIYNNHTRTGRLWQTARVLFLLLLLPMTTMHAAEEEYVFRYVKAEGGTYNNGGTSWDDAKNNLQTAIDDLYATIKGKGLKGYVFVAEGTYVPTRRSTDDADGSTINTSFRIYEGIYVFGGFKGDEVPDEGRGEETLPGKRKMTNGLTYAEDEALIDRDGIDNSVRRWNFMHKTVLSGNHSLVAPTFTYDDARGRYEMSFPMSSYHVVWFGTNGTIDDASRPGHFKALEREACVDGCTIQEGYASSRQTSRHVHTGYGGGVYMVRNALLRNCIVQQCAATLRGGGVYMDGGGEMERCYVHTCQASGIGVEQGYGGGVCIDYDGAVKHSYIIQSGARIGAGLAICHVPGEYPEETAGTTASQYDPFCVATVIANCTSTAEGGGVYLDEGGTLNHCTVVMNKCVGPDVTYYGRRHGRTGGIYVRTCGTVYNTVAWGNSSPVNNDVQFASFREASATASDRINIYHSAFSNHDITNWATATKDAVTSLSSDNYPTDPNLPGNYPCFAQTTAQAGIQYDESDFTVDPTADDDGQPYQKVYNWHPLAVSGLRLKAVQVNNSVQGISNEVLHAHTTIDVVGRPFEAVSSIGALAHSYRKIEHAMVKSQEEGEEGKEYPTVFVDPSRHVFGATNIEADNSDPENPVSASTGYSDDEAIGMSWDLPAGNLPDAIMYFKRFQKLGDVNDEHYGWYQIDGEWHEHVQILVKTGTLIVAGTGSYLENSVRAASIRPTSNMRLYGGFAATYSGTDTDGRNQRKSPTRLSADVISGGYQNNSAHVVSLVNCRNVIIDGFRLYYGNANFTAEEEETTHIVSNGAGLMVSNSNATPAERIDMTGNVLRNCVISNCSSPEGAAIYVNGRYLKANGQMTHAELSVVNTIIRNSSTTSVVELESGADVGGVVVANGNSVIHMDHCGIFNNCGYPLETLNETLGPVGSGEYSYGRIDIHNSIIYANAADTLNDRLSIQNRSELQGLIFRTDYPQSITGTYVYTDILKPGKETCWPTGFDSQTCKALLTYDVSSTDYPVFKNPSRNVGHNEDSDQPLYGGTVDYEPMATNPIVNAAGPAVPTSANLKVAVSSPDLDASSQPRTRGGDPDIGAIESAALPEAGTVLYVTPDGAGRRDGSSWGNAIAGNTVYRLDDVDGPALATGDQMDTESGRVLDADGNPVLTSDDKYCGGFGKVYFTGRSTGGSNLTTITKTWTTETNVYDDGNRKGEMETIATDVPSESSTSESAQGPADTQFEASYGYDPRYPYGEISGQSRSFWRANPYHSGTDWNNAADYANRLAFIAAVNKNGFINNERRERYVSGLQYAVERASAYNTLDAGDAGRKKGVDSVQVWISNGKFTDYKGYIMRNKTTVMGSFPAVRDGRICTPGLTERQALMSDVISIPKALVAENLEARNYESILQISDQDPKAVDANGVPVFDTSAAKFWDDDYTVSEVHKTTNYVYQNRHITHHYSSMQTGKEITSDYLYNYDFTTFNATSKGTTGGKKHFDFGTAPAGFDTWHMSYPDKTNFVVNVETGANAKDKEKILYDPDTNTPTGQKYKGNWIFLSNGSLTGLELWQTAPKVPKGHYLLNLELAGGYRNDYNTTEPTNMYFHIIGNDGSECITPVTLKSTESSEGGNIQDRHRNMAYHYALEFEQPEDGPLTLKIEILDGVRNTKERNGTYGTDNGGDPNEIPSAYTSNWGGANPNRREFWIGNVKLWERSLGGEYVLVRSEETTEARPAEGLPTEVETDESEYVPQNHRTTLRKRVLTMPDVTVPTYGGGGVGNPANSNGKFQDDLAHTDRVPEGNPARDLRTAATLAKQSDSNYQGYTNVFWNGFTIRHGFLYDEAMAHGGGSGACIYEGAHLQNCIIYNNVSACERVKGGGLFCDGATSTIENCFVLNNTSTFGTANTQQNQIFAGGMFMYEGTCFNSLFAKNYSYGSSGGVGFCVGRFYNNTIAYNTCSLKEGGQYSGGAISLATSSNPNLFVANTIIYGNNGIAIRDRATDTNKVNPFLHCYIQSEVPQPNDATNKNVTNWTEEDKTHFGIGNTFLNGKAATQENSPFEADKDYFGKARDANDFRLSSTNSVCVNFGTDDFSGNFYIALQRKMNWKDAEIRSKFVYQQVEKAELPNNDVAYADRIQDCQIDIGAYEYDGAKSIEPDLSEEGKAIFYVSQNGGGGLATASKPTDAACMMKFQKVLDAAGRWKYAVNHLDDNDDNGYKLTNFTKEMLVAELALAGKAASDTTGLKQRTVIVKLSGDYTTTKTGFSYSPTRTSVVLTDRSGEENVLEYSIIVPRGVWLQGGYDDTFSDDTRDIIANPTRLSGKVNNAVTGTTGSVFHVLTFTNNLFGTNERVITHSNSSGGVEYDLLSEFSSEGDRAVVDGCFIQDGQANGTDDPNRLGGGAVVTDFAHIRNCVVTANTASRYGGGLYLEPGALVSGSIIKGNSALQGGGIYVYDPANSSATTSDDKKARLYTSTLLFNDATSTGGGIHFTAGSPNLIANSVAIWNNTANDLANVAGNYNREEVADGEDFYAFNYSGVESLRLPGVNNVLLPSLDSEGVRWDHKDRYEDGSNSGTIRYVPITLSSVLARAGMTYDAWSALRQTYPTLETEDMARLLRMGQTAEEQITMAGGTSVTRVKKDNSFIEIGARVLNASFEVHVNTEHIMRRLFVAKTENLPSPDALERLQQNVYSGSDAENSLVAMYRQMGSSFDNPFHRLGDAFDYIREVRLNPEVGDQYRDERFEVFVSEGEFTPFHDAYGQQGSARMNTFVIPEMVTVVGGVRVDAATSAHSYCQEGYGEQRADGTTIPRPTTLGVPTQLAGETATRSVWLNVATTQQIRDAREHHDYNGNNVFEPWELETQTKLMGSVVDANSEGTTNVYHVITCLADPDQVGQLPTIYRDNDCTTAVPELTTLPSNADERQTVLLEQLALESQASRDRRAVILDGLQISGGHANDIQAEHALLDHGGRQNATQLTYFRGGGILVEGNWDQEFLTQGELPEVLGVAKRNIPLIITNCELQNNQAGNGGGLYSNGSLYISGCHFTQNLSMGPQTPNDQQFIPWTSGGAIASNYDCNVWNSLFDNNEARRGTYKILSSSENSRNTSGITNADERQGSGGVISSSETSIVRMVNCDLVRNKAQQFPAIYNFYDNKRRNDNTARYGRGRHFAVNTIFWGNTVPEELEDEPMALAVPLAAGVTDQRKRYHVANFGPDLDQEVLYFCAYEKGKGLDPQLPATEALRKAQRRILVGDGDIDAIKDGTFFGQNFGSFNNNRLVSSNNLDSDGPFFVQPSTQSGIDGYMQNADWMVSRLNQLIDNGWSYMSQTVTQQSATSSFLNANFQDADGSIIAEGEATHSYAKGLKGGGIYNTFSKNVYDRFSKMGFSNLLPLGDEDYMHYKRQSGDAERNMRRISTYPRMGDDYKDVFVDIGIYEYQYVQLAALGEEVDVVWVGPKQSGRGDGTTAQNCTTDLQVAIETLLLSRNNHDKMVKLIGGYDDDGNAYEYSPTYVVNTDEQDKLSFLVRIPDKDESVTLPARYPGTYFGVNSLTLRGGYYGGTADDSDGEQMRSLTAYPVKLTMKPQAGYEVSQMDHLLRVESMEQRETSTTSDQTAKTTLPRNKVVPLVLDGLTFENPYAEKHDANDGGAAIYYMDQSYTDEDGTDGGWLRPWWTTYTVEEDGKEETSTVTDPHKLIIKDCAFTNNGNGDVAAVNIRRGGGQALVVNSLFHNNGGSPLQAINTKVVNCTFALNGGHLTLSDEEETYKESDGDVTVSYASELHNSIVWKDDRSNYDSESGAYHDNARQYELPDGAPMSHNAITGLTNTDEHADHANVGVSDDNSSLDEGPGFADPDGGDFRQRVSSRIINRASTEVYQRLVPYYDTYPSYAYNDSPNTYAELREVKNDKDEVVSSYYFHSVQRGFSGQLTDGQMQAKAKGSDEYTEAELAGIARWMGSGMERGAYESQAQLARVLYVGPAAKAEEEQDGTSWEYAYDHSRLQDAVDLASIYYEINGQRAYVVVKSSDQTADAMTMREGVTVMGSVNPDFYVEADRGTDDYESSLPGYLRALKAHRSGVAARGAVVSVVKGLLSDGSAEAFTSGFQLDGFKIMDSGQRTTPVVTLDQPGCAITGSLIMGNAITTDGVPVVQLTKGLLYNTLVCGSTAGEGAPTVNAGQHGYVLNCTVAPASGQTGLAAMDGGTVKNCLDAATSSAMFAPYQNITNTAYTLPRHLTEWEPYHYQLHEQSNCIDGGTEDIASWLPTELQGYVDFDHDRDVLGNPRRLGNKVDEGAFETWRISGDFFATNATGTDKESDDYYQANCGGHLYPHNGSVVYVMDGANLVFAVKDDGKPRFAGSDAILPGYVLLKSGASIYGRGNTLRLAQVAAERQLTDMQYALTALPFAYDLAHTYTTSHNGATDALTQTPLTLSALSYDSERRSRWDYSFQEDNSTLWTSMAETAVAANQGWLLDCAGLTTATARFTGWAATEDSYAYEENETDKTVTLTQHNHIDRADATDAHFTHQEDMGWNLVGIPWLVSNFDASIQDADNGTYAMNVPHVLYTMRPTGDYLRATGQVYSCQSWAEGTTLGMGEAFFTQTATLSATEALTFRLPVWGGDTPSPARCVVGVREAGTDGSITRGSSADVYTDVLLVQPSDQATTLAFRPGSDALKWGTLTDEGNSLPQLYLVGADGSRLSLAGAAPLATLLPLGLTVPQAGSYVIDLPQPEAFLDYGHVWLIDHQEGVTLDLLTASGYTVHVGQAGDYPRRLALQIGGQQPDSPTAESDGHYLIYTRGQLLMVKGLTPGDRISIYTLGGRLVERTAATAADYQRLLPTGVYIVRVNSVTRKVEACP